MMIFFRTPEKLELVLLLLLAFVWSFGLFQIKFTPNKIEPLIVVMIVWIISSIADKNKYFNIWMLLISILTAYPVFSIFYLK